MNLTVVLFFMIIGCTGASAWEGDLEWQYWVESKTPVFYAPVQTVPQFREEDGMWKTYDPQHGVNVPTGVKYVWIRVYIPPDTDPDESLFFYSTDQSFQIFLHGNSIYRYGALTRQLFSYGRKWHLINLPEQAIGSYLIFQVYSDNPWVLGQFDRICLDREAHQIERLFIFDLPYISGITAIIVFVMLLGVYFFVQSELRGIYLNLIMLLMMFFLWMLGASSTIYLWLDWPVFWWHVQLIASYLLPVVTNALFLRIIDEEYKKRIRRISYIYGAVCTLAVILELLGLNGMYVLRFAYFPMILVCGGLTGYWLFLSQRRGNVHCRAIFVAFVTMVALSVLDGLSMQFRVFPWHAYLVPFGIYTMAFFIIQLIFDRATHERYLSELSITLESQVHVVTKRMVVDLLTGCYNRNKFSESMRDFMRIARETGEPFSVVMLDIDHFKHINDTYGHDAGDEVLVNFVQTIRPHLDRRHVLIRWGGEEFLILCLHYDGAQAEVFADTIRASVADARLHPTEHITCSGGIGVWYHTEEDSPAQLVKRADMALYAAKQNGRNCVTCEPDWKAHLPQREA